MGLQEAEIKFSEYREPANGVTYVQIVRQNPFQMSQSQIRRISRTNKCDDICANRDAESIPDIRSKPSFITSNIYVHDSFYLTPNLAKNPPNR
ncbi:hypothetical protein CEXT_320111 [Caerostris extrusa]|uniref:Uncharacterized protein n=1 Tax=Caerostris extrusa TaxID=172846 RepID=A0AAV4WXI5_CAEEX|nr:hypothetical protein CEXT_320111 [Caerostris extrusa]